MTPAADPASGAAAADTGDILADTSDAQPPRQVEVIEEGVLSTRLRRPLDLLRMLVGLLAGAVLVVFAWVAASTSADLDESLLTASRKLPDLLVLIMNSTAGFGLLMLPVGISIDLLIRRRGRQLFDALLGLFAASILLTLLSLLVAYVVPDKLQVALTGSLSEYADLFLPLFGGLIAFITVARTMARNHWNVIAGVVVASLTLVSFISGGLTVVGILVSLLLGWVVGLAVRYAMGTPTTRPSGQKVASIVTGAGWDVVLLQAEQSTDFGRRYWATLADERQLQVVVLDRDLEGAGLVSALWRGLRLRTPPADANVNMRRTLDQRALLSYAGQVGGVPAPQLLLVSEVGPDSALLVYEVLAGRRLADLPPSEITDDDLREAFRLLRTLQRARIAHRRLHTGNLLRRPDGTIALLGLGGGVVAASDVASRIDAAELLASTAALVGPQRAVAAGAEVLGADGLARALPVLQRVALSRQTRKALREHKGLLNQLRDALLELGPDGEVEQIQLERVRPKTLLMIVLGSVAGYVLLSQLARVDLVVLFRDAGWGWVALAFACSIGTYAAATWALSGFVPERLPFFHTLGAQFAASFATLISPPTLGTIAINLRYLQRKGVHPALASASIAASQAAALVMHLLLLITVAVAAGSHQDLPYQPPRAVVVAVAAGAAVSLALLAVPAIRNRIRTRFGPLLRQIGPRLVTVVQQPRKLLEGVGGLILLNLFYVAALAGCVYAFGGDLNVSAIAVVYLTGSVVGQAAPTPGGLGAVEAALAAGLTAAGLDGGLAVSAVLMFRLLTFWLPTIPGWFAMNSMQRKGLL